MDHERLAGKYPILYHMAEDGSWLGIQCNGLLSTSSLLDKFEVRGERRRAIESSHRPEMVRLNHPKYGVAFIRDQKPMPENLLLQCLNSGTPRQWYELLNKKVFFWVEHSRLQRFLNAYSSKSRIVLELSTTRMLECYADRIMLSSINSGAPYRPNPAPRGVGTFQKICDFPTEKRVVEFAVDDAVPDVADLVLAVSRWHGTERSETIWERDG